MRNENKSASFAKACGALYITYPIIFFCIYKFGDAVIFKNIYLVSVLTIYMWVVSFFFFKGMYELFEENPDNFVFSYGMLITIVTPFLAFFLFSRI